MKQRIGLAALAAALISSGAAHGADILGKGGSLKDSDPTYEVSRWQGPYVGLGVGHQWSEWKDDTHCEVLKEDADGWLVTGRVGYDWQRGRVVFGPVGELNWLNPKDTKNFDEAEFSGAVMFRAGYLVNERVLVYGIGGIEIIGYDELDEVVNPTLGGGLEFLLGDGWTLLGEGRVTWASNEDLPAGIDKDDVVTARAMVVKRF
jgi:opacity protein-like surface antigen